MKKISVLFGLWLVILFAAGQTNSFAQSNPPENFYVTPVGMATWDSIQADEFQFYKLFLNGAFVVDTDSVHFQFGTVGEELVAGETYLAEIAALYNDGLSEKVGFEFVYLPCDSFPNYNQMDAYNLDGSDDVMVVWSDLLPMELIEINQGYGDPVSGYFQNFGYGYGVTYDFSLYPDALIHAVDFRHSSWGNLGTWNYMIHIINQTEHSYIASIGPFQTTGNDTWEEMIELGDVPINGVNEVAILMEPLGNVPTDAYPCIDGDASDNPQGSIVCDLNELSNYNASNEGNFLMDIHIYTYNYKKEESDHLGTHIYLDNELISFVPVGDTFFIIEDFPPYGYHDICIDKVYSNDNGNHSWTSCYGDLCINDIGTGWPCLPPENLVVIDEWINNNVHYVFLQWDTAINNVQELIGFHIVRDNIQITEEPIDITQYIDSIGTSFSNCYEVFAIYEECWSDPSNETCSFFIGINDIANNIVISPNPVHSLLNITSNEDIKVITLYNPLGQVIGSVENINHYNFQQDISYLKDGVYFLVIKTENHSQTSKIIIQH